MAFEPAGKLEIDGNSKESEEEEMTPPAVKRLKQAAPEGCKKASFVEYIAANSVTQRTLAERFPGIDGVVLFHALTGGV